MDSSHQRVKHLDDLLAFFHESETPREDWRIGTEGEKFGICVTGKPIAYSGKQGIEALLQALCERYQWQPFPEYAGGPLIALKRDEASITLEPGGQLELSGAPFRSIHQTADELDRHLQEVRSISEAWGVQWLGLGFHPLARRDELPSVPKLRYTIMKEYFPTRGELGLDMMFRTCTVQANLDYSDEADAMRKLQVALKLQPLITGLFANSPFKEGKDSGYQSCRALVWRDTDPDRCGLLPQLWSESSSYRDYVEWALDVPMFLIKREDTILRNTGQSFRSFMQDGFEGEHATREDWKMHLGSLFPEVRLKNTIEVRGADAQSRALHLALPALWKGLLYDDTALAAAIELSATWDYPMVEASREAIAQNALNTELDGKPLRQLAQTLVTLALEGLARLGDKDKRGHDETGYLEPLVELLADGTSAADRVLECAGGQVTLAGLSSCTRVA